MLFEERAMVGTTPKSLGDKVRPSDDLLHWFALIVTRLKINADDGRRYRIHDVSIVCSKESAPHSREISSADPGEWDLAEPVELFFGLLDLTSGK
jgi:hypothetical protein